MIRTTSQNSYINTRGSHPEVSYQKTILNILQNSQKNIYAVVSFLRKLLTENLKMSEAATVDLLMFCKNRCSLKMRLVFQNQPFIDPLQNRCSWIIRKIHRKKPVLESLFNKDAVLRTFNFINKDSDTGIFLWNLETF